MTQFTDLQLIESYIARRNHIAELTKAFQAQVKPFQEQMDTIENEMLRRLNERGAEHSSTDAGTAYKEQVMSVKCTDKDAMLKFAFDNFASYGKDLLSANVSKETLRLYIDKTKSPEHPDGLVPPGLNVSFLTTVKFRKA